MSLAKESKPRRKSGSEKLRNFPQLLAEKFSSSKVKNVQAFSLKDVDRKQGENPMSLSDQAPKLY
jgi:hypothetical protein